MLKERVALMLEMDVDERRNAGHGLQWASKEKGWRAGSCKGTVTTFGRAWDRARKLQLTES